MTIPLISKIKPQNNGAFPIAEDIDVMGGFQVRADTTDRDSIPSLNRKHGMRVYTVADNHVWQLGATLLNADWSLVISTSPRLYIPAVVDGQTAFTLPGQPVNPAAVVMVVNTQVYYPPIHFTVSGITNQNIVWLVLFALEAVDDVMFLYDEIV